MKKKILAIAIMGLFTSTAAMAETIGTVNDGQLSLGNDTKNVNVKNKAKVGKGDLNHASGNIGVNISSGNGNQQTNATALATSSSGFVAADVDANQNGLLNYSLSIQSKNKASGGKGNLNHASGNIGVNVAAGDGNQQANGVAIARGDLVHAKASAEADQDSIGNNADLNVGNWNDNNQTDANTAVAGEHSLNHAHGNISVNVTAGSGNQQKNDLALVAYTGPEADTSALANVIANQTSIGNMATNANLTNTATLGDGMLNHATGNISVNVSAGAFNQQANLLSISNAK